MRVVVMLFACAVFGGLMSVRERSENPWVRAGTASVAFAILGGMIFQVRSRERSSNR